MADLTEPQARALRILRHANGPLTCRAFAKKMWPDSSGWRTLSDVRNGVVRGKAMPGLAGRMLFRMRRLGLVFDYRSKLGQYSYEASPKGLRLLAAMQAEQERRGR